MLCIREEKSVKSVDKFILVAFKLEIIPCMRNYYVVCSVLQSVKKPQKSAVVNRKTFRDKCIKYFKSNCEK